MGGERLLLMSGFSPVLIFALSVGLILVIAIIGGLQAARRREAWRALAERLGCSFSRSDPFDIPRACAQALFKQGSSRRATNVLHGTIGGRAIKCFDYQYTTGSGDNESTHYLTCLLVTPPIPFQPLSIRPESFLDRVGEFFGLDDIDFESDEFSRRFFVTCPDKKFAYDILHPRAMELLLEGDQISLEAQRDSVLLHYSKVVRQLNLPDEVETFIRRGLRFMELIPDYLIEQEKGTM